jgi:hypothetical protein
MLVDVSEEVTGGDEEEGVIRVGEEGGRKS